MVPRHKNDMWSRGSRPSWVSTATYHVVATNTMLACLQPGRDRCHPKGVVPLHLKGGEGGSMGYLANGAGSNEGPHHYDNDGHV